MIRCKKCHCEFGDDELQNSSSYCDECCLNESSYLTSDKNEFIIEDFIIDSNIDDEFTIKLETKIIWDRSRNVNYNGSELIMNTYECSSCKKETTVRFAVHNINIQKMFQFKC